MAATGARGCAVMTPPVQLAKLPSWRLGDLLLTLMQAQARLSYRAGYSYGAGEFDEGLRLALQDAAVGSAAARVLGTLESRVVR